MSGYFRAEKMKVSKADSDWIKQFNKYSHSKQLSEIPKLKRDKVQLLAKCLSCIVRQNDENFKLTEREKKVLKKTFSPYKLELRKLAAQSGSQSLHNQIQRQTGRGIILSTLIGAAIPLIAKLVKKIIGKK